jgi:hypothetical protein
MTFRRVPLLFSFSGAFFAVRILLAAIALLFAVPVAQPASIDVRSSGGAMALVMVEGDLELADIETFRNKVASVGKAAVAFRSDGGSLLAGIRIGMMIRVRNFTSVVPDASQCASACAVAWLGGVHRFLGQGAKVGFHAAYVQQKTGTTAESGPGNAVLGAYLDQIGLPEDAIVYITQASPNSMKWLSMEEAAQHGIDVALLPPPETIQPPGPNSPNTVPSVVASIPSAVASQEQPQPQTSLAGRATALVFSLAARWSEANGETLRALDNLYVDKVFYHGKMTPRQAVLAEKRVFAERWPQRTYKIRPHSVTVSCNASTEICRVQGVMDRELVNPTTSAKSRDVTNFDYSIAGGGPALKIASETSTVNKIPEPTDESSPLTSFVARLFSQVSKIRQATSPTEPPPTRPSTPPR